MSHLQANVVSRPDAKSASRGRTRSEHSARALRYATATLALWSTAWLGAAIAGATFATIIESSSLARAQAAAPGRPPGAGRRTSRAARQTKAPPPPSAGVQAELAQAQQLLDSDSREEIETGIQSLGLLGIEHAVEPLAARIRRGLPSDLLELAVTTLMAIGQPNAGPVLYELTWHRRAEVRKRVVEAIAATKPAGAEAELLRMLSDEDARVRSAAAVEVGTGHAVERLFLALDRGNAEASVAIGRLVAPAAVEKLVHYLGRIPFHQMGPALTGVIERRDVPDAKKIELIARLEELGTAEVKSHLSSLLAASGESLTPAVNRAVARAVQQIDD
jgi:hypothetical protein